MKTIEIFFIDEYKNLAYHETKRYILQGESYAYHQIGVCPHPQKYFQCT